MTNNLSFCKLSIMLTMLAVTGMFSSCRKPFEKDNPKPASTIDGQVSVIINAEEMYACLPQTIMNNLAGDVHLYLNEAQWRYEQEYVMVRIPLNNEANRTYLYGVKPYNAPLGPTRSFLVQFRPDAGSTPSDFSGRQMWLNLQDWKKYGVKYVHNHATEFMEPVGINPSWEAIMLDAGLFYIDPNGKIAVHDEPRNPNPPGPYVPWDGDNDKEELVQIQGGRGFFQRLMAGIGGVILSLNDFLGEGSGGSAPPWNQNGGEGGIYGGNDGFEPPQPPGGNNNWTPPPPPPINIWDNTYASNNNWSELGENPSIPVPIYVEGSILTNATEGGNNVLTINNPVATYLQSTLGLTTAQTNWIGQNLDKATPVMNFLVTYIPGLTQQQKVVQAKNHIKMMIGSPSYLSFIQNYMQNNTGMWWVNESWLDPYGGLGFGSWAMDYLPSHPDVTIDYLLTNKNGFDDLQGEVDDYQDGGYDNTIYPQTDPNLPWPTIAAVIPTSQFVGWGHPGVRRNCMDYAKKQIAVAGYQISGYGAPGQTFQIYKASTGVNNSALVQGLSYIRYALAAGIPVIVGVDDQPGSPNPGTDNTTDHFIVIVGMGTNSTGKYLQFYDNADGTLSRGTSSSNLLYYDAVTGYVQGTSQARYAQGMTYRLTMIRKSKPL